MGASKWVLKDGHGVALGVDVSPNTAEPAADRVFAVERLQAGTDALWLAADGTCSVELWMKDVGIGATSQWVLVLAAVGLVSHVLVPGAALAVPFGAPLFARVTVAGTATKAIAGLTTR